MKNKIHSTSREAGMTLPEVLISILLLSLMMIAFLGLLDSTSRLAKVQTGISDSTESLRYATAALVRIARMAGSGGLPVVAPGDPSIDYDATAPDPTGRKPLAVELQYDNTAGGLIGGRTVRVGTDIFIMRGVVFSELYEVLGEVSLDLGANEILIPSKSPYPSGRDQLLDFPDNPSEKGIVLASMDGVDLELSSGGWRRRYGGYRIVEVESGETPVIGDTADANGIYWMTIPITTSGGEHEGLNPYGSFVAPQDPGIVYGIGFMDVLTYFVGVNDSGGWSLYVEDGSGTAQELVPDIYNLQIALGCDDDHNGEVQPQEWYHSKENSAAADLDALANLLAIRLSIVTRSRDPEMKRVEHVTMPENSPQIYGDDLQHRYRVVTVQAWVRSHPKMEVINL